MPYIVEERIECLNLARHHVYLGKHFLQAMLTMTAGCMEAQPRIWYDLGYEFSNGCF